MTQGLRHSVEVLAQYGVHPYQQPVTMSTHATTHVDKCNLALCLRGTIDAVFILRRMQEEYHAKGKKLHICLVDLEKAFDRVQRRLLEWAMRKHGIPNVLARSVMSLYEGAKTRVRVDSELSEEPEHNEEMHQGSVLSQFLLAVVVDVVTEFVRDGVLSELLYADDLILMNE